MYQETSLTEYVMVKSEILTCSGDYFSFINPEAYHFEIETIAHALSQLCRFTGHTSAFYSVAQHSVLVSGLVPREMQLAGLLHDATEAFVGDMTKPLKDMFPEFRRIEKNIERAICRQYGIPCPLPHEIKQADLILLATEKRDLMPHVNDQWNYLEGVEAMKEKITPWSPALAKERFLERFYELDGLS
ncbi:metal-dependent phosphohydrolase [Oxalobacter sp. OttesenSCG-928-P03]|nr:metal-dependent phosphohydrolase [Oxalobacter sp. OttesenSCG-928-P03]